MTTRKNKKWEKPSYRLAHIQLAKARGKASEYQCTCGYPATTWAYDKSDPNELFDGYAYSLDWSRYEPQCSSCHALKDHNKTHCPKGHPYTDENTTPHTRGDNQGRKCRVCNRERERAR